MIVHSAIIFLCVIMLILDHRKESRQKLFFCYFFHYFLYLYLINIFLIIGLNNVYSNASMFTTNVHVLYKNIVKEIGTGFCFKHVS